uniref:hypothetical protein n=1 Tax=Nonomuraea pusilla TaxID=46177 RepID=UPI000A9EF07F|nr:hypothetical protein [Nonomuraea pusilla]
MMRSYGSEADLFAATPKAALHRAAMTHDDAALAVQRLIDTHAARAQIGLPRRP